MGWKLSHINPPSSNNNNYENTNIKKRNVSTSPTEKRRDFPISNNR